MVNSKSNLSGDASLSGKSLSSELSGDVTYGAEIPSSFFEKVDLISDVKNEWDFELTGWPVCQAEEEELPLDFQVPGAIYIKIKSYDATPTDLTDLTFYRFYIYRNGFENINGYLSNEIGYSDPTDCLEAAIQFVKDNWKLVIASYSEYMNESLQNSDIRVQDLERYMHNSFSFIPDTIIPLKDRSKKIICNQEVIFKL